MSDYPQQGNQFLNPGKERQQLQVFFESHIISLIADPFWDFVKVGNSMLYHVKTSLKYDIAKMWCQGLGAQLVELWNEQEYQDLVNY